MELRRYLYLFRQRWALIVACVLVGALIGFGVTPRTDKYRASAEIYVGTRLLAQNPNELYAEPGLNEIVTTLAEMIPSPGIAERVISATGIRRSVGTVVGETKATVVTGTTLINVTATDTDPRVAQELANGMSNTFADQANNYVVGSAATPGTVPYEPAYVFQQSGVPSSPIGTGLARKVSLGAVLGLIVAILIVLLLDYLDISVRNPGEVEDRLGIPVLGVVPSRPTAAASLRFGSRSSPDRTETEVV